MSMPTTVEILRGAKDVLAARGWHQGDFYDDSARKSGTSLEVCPVCLLGALDVAVGCKPGLLATRDEFKAREAVDSLLVQIIGCAVALWNDRKGRTLDEVYALLDDAIERAEAGESR